MTEHRMTTDDEAMLLRGQTPDGRPELQMLAQSLAEFRGASLGLAPRASATLAARLASNEPLPEGAAPAIARRAPRRVIVGRIVAASIAVVVIISAFGSANALPPAVQVVFDKVVTTVVPGIDRQSPSIPVVPVEPTSVTEIDRPPVVEQPTESGTRPTPHSTPPGQSGETHGNSGGNGNGGGNKGKSNSGDNPGAANGGGKKR